MQLILWDIDGTLVSTAGHGRYAFFEAFETVFGRPLEDDPPMAMGGRTDHSIALEIMELGGVEDAERHLPAMFDALHEALKPARAPSRAEGAPQPGVREAIAAIDERGDAIQSLLTGNIEPNAHVKLAAFGLDELRGHGHRRLRLRPRRPLRAGGHRPGEGAAPSTAWTCRPSGSR